MNKGSNAQEIGKRCRRYRQALGMSLEELGEKINYTGAYISTLERHGIDSISLVQILSDALGYNLFSDENDAEGTVGEIGKEILFTLIKGGFESTEFGNTRGSIATSDLMSRLYGLSKKRITEEIFKLAEYGLCVREHYQDFYNVENDRIFITAKGVITVKHLDAEARMSEDMKSVITYEMLCGDYDSYQEVVDNDETKKTLRNMLPDSAFRVNFIEYLHKHFDDALFSHSRSQYLDKRFFPGHNCFYDIIYSMAIELDRDEADGKVTDNPEYEDMLLYQRIDELEEKLHINDPVLFDFDSKFSSEVSAVPEHTKDNPAFIDEQPISEELGELYDAQCEVMFELTPDIRFLRQKDKHDEGNPIDWFSVEDITDFVERNILPPTTEKEKAIDLDIRKIISLNGESLNYFRFPYAWESNGLADLIRKKYGYI